MENVFKSINLYKTFVPINQDTSSPMDYSLGILVFFFALAILAGVIDAIAGGGGLITIPFLLVAGIPPIHAISTNKMGGVGGSLASSLHFIRIGEVNLKRSFPMMLSSFLGALLGGIVLTKVNSDFLSYIIPFLLIGFSLYFLFSPSLGELDKKSLISPALYGFFVASSIGFYDGFFGPGTGTFFAISFTLLLGYNLIKATAHAKLLNFCSNVAALIYFIIAGTIIWQLGIILFCGQVIGGVIGARLVVSKGKSIIKMVMVIVTIGISAKLLLS